MITRHILCVYMNVCASDEKWVFEYEAFYYMADCKIIQMKYIGKIMIPYKPSENNEQIVCISHWFLCVKVMRESN